MNRRGSNKIMLLPLLVAVVVANVVQTAAEETSYSSSKTSEPPLKPNAFLSTTKDSIKFIPGLPEVPSNTDFTSEQTRDYARVLANPKKALIQEINALSHSSNNNDEAATDKNIEKVFSRVSGGTAAAARERKRKEPESRVGIIGVPILKINSTGKIPHNNKLINDFLKTQENPNLKHLEELISAEAGNADKNNEGDDIDDDDDVDVDDDDDDDDEDDDDEGNPSVDEDEDDEDEDDDEEEDDDEDDEDLEEDEINGDNGDIKTEEDIITQCPDYCRCSGQYAASTTAVCSKLVDKKKFGMGIGHLKIENAGDLVLGPHAFRDRSLQQLESITIVDTHVSSLDRAAFDGVSFLFSVNLSRNGIIDIHPDTFENNTQLSLLTISGHPYWRNWTVHRNYLLNAPSLTELVFSWNSMPNLPTAAFEKMPNLGYLDLKSNRLGKVDKATFAPLKYLVELDLSSNMLSHLPSDTFESTDLRILRIGDNFLTSLRTINASKLTVLEVESNHIKVIEQNDLSGVPSLNSLVITWNGLQRIHDHAFAHLTDLDHLDISNNNLTILTNHHFRNNSALQHLIISNNPELKVLPKFIVKGPEFNRFSISRFECANCGLNNIDKGTFNSMPALSKLNLARNYLIGLPDGLFLSLSSLFELDLSDNAISHITPNMLEGAISLEKLNLAGNPLVTLQATPFLRTKALTRLDVSRCQLKRVWSEARTRLRSLRYMTLHGNKLERITVEELKATPKLSGLDISQNPLVCDADFKSAMQWLTRRGIMQSEVQQMSNLQTSSYIEEKRPGQWSDLAKVVCASVDEPPPRRMPVPSTPLLVVFSEDENDAEISKAEIEKSNNEMVTDHGQRLDGKDEDTWPIDDDKNEEYEDYDTLNSKPSIYRSWYGGPMWPLLTTILVAASALLIILQTARYVAQRRGRVPVLRGLNLYPSLDVNKNSGAVYKPLHEEIPTPKLTKKGGFFLISPWTHSQVVPESV